MLRTLFRSCGKLDFSRLNFLKELASFVVRCVVPTEVDIVWRNFWNFIACVGRV